MVSKKLRSFLLTAAMGFVMVVVSIGLPQVSPVLALERAGTESVYLDPSAQPPPNEDNFLFIGFFDDDLRTVIYDLSGNAIAEGEHGGKVRCNGSKCSQMTHLSIVIPGTDEHKYNYRFMTGQAFDLVEERVVVAGKGTISYPGHKNERFTFTATFQNNRDGSTVSVRYDASRPDASFVISEAPGKLEFRSR